MFKYIKVGLYILITGIILMLSFIAWKQFDLENVPNAPTIIQITENKNIYPKTEIIHHLEQAAHKNKYQLTLLRITRVNNHVKKDTYDFNKSSQAQPATFKKNTAEKITQKQLQYEDLRGSYYTTAQGKDLTKLLLLLQKNGLKATTERNSLVAYIKDSEIFDSYLPIILSLVSMILIIMFMEKIRNLKKYAILYLNGIKTNKIILRDFKKNFLAFVLASVALVIGVGIYALTNLTSSGWRETIALTLLILGLISILFIMLDLISYSALVVMNLYSAIKGDNSSNIITVIGYIFKATLVVIVAVNVFSLQSKVNTLKKDESIMHMWINKHSGYTVQFNQIDENEKAELTKVENLSKKLIQLSPEVLLAKSNQEFHPDPNSIQPENGNVIIVNSTYLKYNHFLTTTGKKLHLKKKANTIYTLIPEKRLFQKNDFEKELRAFLEFQNTLKNKKNRSIEKIIVIPIKDDNQVFNYTIGKEIEASISNNPILIIDDNNLSKDFYWASLSQGMIQFANLTALQKNIKKLGLTSYVNGITDAKTRLSEFNATISREIFILVIISILSILQLVFVISFISLSFLERNRKKLAVNKIFGVSNQKMIVEFAAFNLIGDILISSLVAVVEKNGVGIIFMLPYFIIEGIVIILLYYYAQKDLLTTLNKGN